MMIERPNRLTAEGSHAYMVLLQVMLTHFEMIVCVLIHRHFDSPAAANSLLKNGDWLRRKSIIHLNAKQCEVPVPLFQHGFQREKLKNTGDSG